MMRKLGYQTQVHRKSELCIYFYFDQSLVATRKEIVIYCLQCENHLFYKRKPSMTELFQQTSCESWSNGDFANPFNQCRHQTHSTYQLGRNPLPCQASTGPEDLWFRSSGWSTTRRRCALSSEILVINPTQIITLYLCRMFTVIIKVRDETKPNEKDMVGFEVWPILKPSLKKCWWDLNRKLKWVSWTSESSQSEYIGRVAACRFNMWGVFFDNDNEGAHQ